MSPILKTTPSPTTAPAQTPAARQNELRDTINRFLGSVFFGPLLRSARDSSLKGAVGHGGRGEEVFQGQLDQVLAERAGTATSFRNTLGDALFDRYARAAVAVGGDRSDGR